VQEKQGVTAQFLETLYHHINAGHEVISFNVGETLCRVWLGNGDRRGDTVWRKANIEELVREKKTPPSRPPAPAKAKGFRVRLCIEDEKELQVLGCGWRIVTVELAGSKIHLHHNGNTATMKRKAFKELLAVNKRLRRMRRPALRLVVSNPPPVLISAEAA
jgi:hypothetical protein